MTTTTQTHGGGAQPARIDTSGKNTGGKALRVYGFDSEADALAAGYICEGGPAMSVALVTDESLAEGDPSALVIYTAPDNILTEGGFAVPVYPVNGWGSTPAPSGPAPILDLEADTLVLSDGDPVGTWADQSGNHRDFAQTGSARPTFHTDASGGYVQFDGVDDLLISSWTDNISGYVAFFVYQYSGSNTGDFILAKGSYASGGAYQIEARWGVYAQQDETGSQYFGWDAKEGKYMATLGRFAIRIVKSPNIVDVSSVVEWCNDSPALTLDTFSEGGPTSVNSPLGWAIGNFPTGETFFMPAKVKAVVLYASTLTDPEITTILSDLKERYTIQYFPTPFISMVIVSSFTTGVYVIVPKTLTSSDFTAGVTIKVNGSPATISGVGDLIATDGRLGYSLQSITLAPGDVVTFAYNAAVGDIADNGTPIASIAETDVINTL